MKFVDLNKQYESYKDEIDSQIKDVISTTSFIMGPKVKELESILADYVGMKFAVGCASGTDALLLALMAYDIQPWDEIITTPFTFISTAEVISLLKAKPVFVDIDAETYNIDSNKIQTAITEKTKGIIAVDIFGQCADYDTINSIAQKNNLFVIEDGAQSFGAKYKDRMACSLSETTCTSFFPAKPFGCFGDGGMVFTNNEKLSNVMSSLRLHGKGSHKYDHERIGLNARLDTLQAAILIAKFKYLDEEIKKRNQVADYYTENLRDLVKTPIVLDDNLSAYAQYSIQIENRDELQTHLKEKGIPTAIHYPKPLHLQKAFNDLNYKENDFPVTEQVCKNIISLPMHAFLTREEQDLIIEVLTLK